MTLLATLLHIAPAVRQVKLCAQRRSHVVSGRQVDAAVGRCARGERRRLRGHRSRSRVSNALHQPRTDGRSAYQRLEAAYQIGEVAKHGSMSVASLLNKVQPRSHAHVICSCVLPMCAPGVVGAYN